MCSSSWLKCSVCCFGRPVRPNSFLGFGYLSRFSRLNQHRLHSFGYLSTGSGRMARAWLSRFFRSSGLPLLSAIFCDSSCPECIVLPCSLYCCSAQLWTQAFALCCTSCRPGVHTLCAPCSGQVPRSWRISFFAGCCLAFLVFASLRRGRASCAEAFPEGRFSCTSSCCLDQGSRVSASVGCACSLLVAAHLNWKIRVVSRPAWTSSYSV